MGSRVVVLVVGDRGIAMPCEDAVDGVGGKPLDEGESGIAELLGTRVGEELVGR